MIKQSIDIANSLIKEDIVDIKNNGTLYITDDDNLSIQSRNISTTHLYWWRLNQYNDNQKTKTIVKELRKQVKNSMSLITRAMTGFIGVVLGLNYYQNLLKMDSGRNAIEKQIKDRVLSLQSIG